MLNQFLVNVDLLMIYCSILKDCVSIRQFPFLFNTHTIEKGFEELKCFYIFIHQFPYIQQPIFTTNFIIYVLLDSLNISQLILIIYTISTFD